MTLSSRGRMVFTSDAAIFEIYVSDDGTWTVLMLDVTGPGSVLAAGDGWESSVEDVRETEPRHGSI
jgi:hypothetical protein